MNYRFATAVAVGAWAVMSATPTLAGQWVYTYQSAQLTLLPDAFHAGAESEARDVNIGGQIVGWSHTSAGVPNAWLLEPAGVYLHAGIPLATEFTTATGVNNAGEVVGNWSGGGKARGFHWHPSTGFSLLSDDFQPSEGVGIEYLFSTRAINDFGFVVGFTEVGCPGGGASFSTCRLLPTYWERPDQRPHPTHYPGEDWGVDRATAVNNYGWIAGYETTTRTRGFRWHQGTLSYVPWPAGGIQDGIRIWGMNESAAVAGSGVTSPGAKVRALYWDGTSAASQLLGVLPGGERSEAFDLNDEHIAVGYSERALTTGSGQIVGDRAFLWSAHMGMVELPASPTGTQGLLFTHCRANALANFQSAGGSQGVIRVVGYCGNETKRAARWDVTLSRIWVR
jgi:uncharacterized membrane protein